MAYCLELDESAPRGMVRVIREQLRDARGHLLRADGSAPHRVHEFRKCLKKVRGAVRLVRLVLGEEPYKKQNIWARDTARQFAHLRDADAMLEALARLDARYGADRKGVTDAIRAAETAFLDLRERAGRDGGQLEDLAPDAIGGVDAALEHVSHWQLPDHDFATIEGGLAKTYRRGRRAFRAAYRDPTAKCFHEWRKRVKYHWYHVRLLEAIWPAIMGTRRTTLDHLGELLGEHHDLAVLRGHVQNAWDEFDQREPMLSLIEASDLRQAEIYDEARLIGRRVYAESPERLVQRLGDYWRAARTRGSSAPAQTRANPRSGSRHAARRRGAAGAAS
jgi:CHAD domain-containing protein